MRLLAGPVALKALAWRAIAGAMQAAEDRVRVRLAAPRQHLHLRGACQRTLVCLRVCQVGQVRAQTFEWFEGSARSSVVHTEHRSATWQ